MNKYYKPVEAEIDLHQMTKEEARKETMVFLEDSQVLGLKKVRIITGKGLHSKDGVGILNAYVKSLLDGAGFEYQNAKYNEGGEGALDVFI